MKTPIWTFRTARFLVIYSVTEDYDLDLSWDVTGEVRAKLESGEYQSFGAIIEVQHRETGLILGESSLWGCIYSDPKAFIDHRGIKEKSRKDGRNYGSYFSDMVREAVKEARSTLTKLCKE